MNTIKVIIPVRIKSKKKNEKKEVNGFEKKEVNEFENNTYFFNHILAQVEKIKKYDYTYEDILTEMYVFATGNGFVAINYQINNTGTDEIIKICENSIKKIDKILQSMGEEDSKEKYIVDKIKEIANIDVKKCYWFFLFDKNDIVKSDALLFKMLHLDEPNIETNGKFSNDENSYEIKYQFSKGNWCCISTKCMGVFYNKEDSRNDYLSKAFFVMFMLLQNEKTMLIEFKKTIITNDSINYKDAKRLKCEVLECLSKYSFENVSDNTICQNVYIKYKNILGLSDMENTMQELIFALNDNIQRGREKAVTIVTVIISILELVSVISSILSIIDFF